MEEITLTADEKRLIEERRAAEEAQKKAAEETARKAANKRRTLADIAEKRATLETALLRAPLEVLDKECAAQTVTDDEVRDYMEELYGKLSLSAPVKEAVASLPNLAQALSRTDDAGLREKERMKEEARVQAAREEVLKDADHEAFLREREAGMGMAAGWNS